MFCGLMSAWTSSTSLRCSSALSLARARPHKGQRERRVAARLLHRYRSGPRIGRRRGSGGRGTARRRAAPGRATRRRARACAARPPRASAGALPTRSRPPPTPPSAPPGRPAVVGERAARAAAAPHLAVCAAADQPVQLVRAAAELELRALLQRRCRRIRLRSLRSLRWPRRRACRRRRRPSSSGSSARAGAGGATATAAARRPATGSTTRTTSRRRRTRRSSWLRSLRASPPCSNVGAAGSESREVGSSRGIEARAIGLR